MWRGALAIFVGFATALQAASPHLDRINPPGGQRGAELELTITGQRLGDAKGLLFYSPGIEVESITPEGEGKVHAKLKIAADCALGEHAWRVWTATGVTELTTLAVGPFPNVEEVEPNNDPAHAQKIALNTTVNGVIKEEDIDYFSVEMKKGQRLTAEVEGMRLGQTMFDPWLAITTKDGRVLATNDDNALFLQDPLASVLAPEDGTCFIAVRESAWGGSDKCQYRLHVGTFPQPLTVYPLGGQKGEALAVTQLGDAAGPIAKTIVLPAEADASFPVFAELDGMMAPAANLIRVSSFPNVLEIEPNNSVAQATTTDQPLPLAFNGVIGEKGDADFFKFTAKKDQALDVNVYARRLRSPLDSVLTLYNDKGHQLASNDDSAGPDSSLRFQVPADGQYCLAVKDQLARGGPTFTYRVEVTLAAPDVALTIPEMVKDSQERQTIVVPRGNRYGAIFRVKRSDFSGSLKVSASDLPAGVSAQSDALADSGDTLPVVFEATPEAEVAGKLCDLDAVPEDGKNPARGHFNQHVELIIGQPNNTVYFTADVARLPVLVADAAPFKIEVVQPKVPIVQSGAMNLRIVATRAEGFTGAINCLMLWSPPGLGAQATVTIPAGQNEVALPLNANDNAPVRKWKTAVVASADAGKGAVWVSSQLIDLNIEKPFVTAKLVRTQTEQGQPATIVCQLTQNRAFAGPAKLQLLGLPNKVTAPEVEITAADHEAKFEVTTEASSPAGQHKGLFCQLTIMQDGEPIVENIAQGGVLRIDKPVEKKVAAQ